MRGVCIIQIRLSGIGTEANENKLAREKFGKMMGRGFLALIG